MQTVMSMKASGLMTRHMVMEPTSMRTEPPTSVSGSKISNLGRELRSGQTVPDTKECTKTARSMAMAASPSLILALTRVNSKIMRSQASASIYGLMVKSTKDNGIRTRCTGRESSSGKTPSDTKANS